MQKTKQGRNFSLQKSKKTFINPSVQKKKINPLQKNHHKNPQFSIQTIDYHFESISKKKKMQKI